VLSPLLQLLLSISFAAKTSFRHREASGAPSQSPSALEGIAQSGALFESSEYRGFIPVSILIITIKEN
jgi:hypothetical protein